jgi:hypothetical protein
MKFLMQSLPILARERALRGLSDPSFRVIQENDHPVAIGCLGKFQDIMDGLFVAALL